MSAQLFVILIIVGVLWLLYIPQASSSTTTWSSSTGAWAKENCQDSCGQSIIPYPFGIGKNCSFDDEWFQIDCRGDKGTNSVKPYLKRLNLEVQSIGIIQNTIQLLIPLDSDNCTNSSSNNSSTTCEPLRTLSLKDLGGTPFLFLDRSSFSFGNVLYTDLCDLKANRDDDPWIRWSVSSCYGDGFCWTYIRQNFQTLEPIIEAVGKNTYCTNNKITGGPCRYAFLASMELNYYIKGSWYNNSCEAIFPLKQVPVSLNWELYNTTSTSLGLDDGNKFHCQNINVVHDSPTTYIRCDCISTGETIYLPRRCPGKHVNWKSIIIGLSSAIGALLLTIGVWSLYRVVKKQISKKKKKKFFKLNGGLLLQKNMYSTDGNVEKTKLFNSNELEKATDQYNMNRVLGQGGQGTVFKGMLSDGRIVAVKRSKIDDSTKVEQFINEVVILSQINHRNIVKLLGCCLETEVPLLVYEFIPNGTLFQHIHEPLEELFLTWEMRLRIATETAGALSYMHYAASMPIYHRDIKSSNILLDDKYNARVADFGTSKSVHVDKTHFTTLVQGTFGYLDPEYFQTSQFTEKSDVYSFGVVLVELLTGIKPIFSDTSQEFKGLASHFIQSMEEDNFLGMIDRRIFEKGKIKEMVAVAQVAKKCLHLKGKKRPSMKEVASQLDGIRMSQGQIMPQENDEAVENDRISLFEGYHAFSTSAQTWCESSASSLLEVRVNCLSFP